VYTVDDFELNIMPKLSDALGVRWSRIVNSDNLTYSSDLDDEYSDGYRIYLNVTVKVSDTCTIIKRGTGKTKTVSKYVEVEVEEFEYVVDCSEVDTEV
ncbi:MAG: hypothetical protein KKC55_16075, partial [Gammaproteobacteria bacterium]|nr:hypothetical protein [Gammaproteobacteria bacterium]